MDGISAWIAGDNSLAIRKTEHSGGMLVFACVRHQSSIWLCEHADKLLESCAQAGCAVGFDRTRLSLANHYSPSRKLPAQAIAASLLGEPYWRQHCLVPCVSVVDRSTIRELDVQQAVQEVSKCGLLADGADSALSKRSLTGELIEVVCGMRTMATDTTPAFIKAGLLPDAVLCEAVADTALTEASHWCSLQEREKTARTMGTDSNIEGMIRATRRVAQALFTLANLLEADSAHKTIIKNSILSKHPDIVHQIAAVMQHGYDEASCATELHKRDDLEASTTLCLLLLQDLYVR
eukprot:3162-Heterococcus_DN1.PRE.2